jgi:hypothetical protein
VVEQDVRVLEEPRRQYEGQWDAPQAGFDGNVEKPREDDHDAGGSASGRAEQVGEEGGVGVVSVQQLSGRLLRFSRWWWTSIVQATMCVAISHSTMYRRVIHEASFQNKCFEYV